MKLRQIMFSWTRPPKDFCGKCEAGWVRVPDPVARRIYRNHTQTAMIRCECRRGPKFSDYEKRVIGWKAPR